MAARILLCVDETTCANPAAIGLEGERLETQEWLGVCCDGGSARACVSETRSWDEVWVVSCQDVAPINLAAALKSDHPELCVRLVDFEAGGSLLSRAHTAHIDEVMGRRAFVVRYGREKAKQVESPEELPAEPQNTGARSSGKQGSLESKGAEALVANEADGAVPDVSEASAACGVAPVFENGGTVSNEVLKASRLAHAPNAASVAVETCASGPNGDAGLAGPADGAGCAGSASSAGPSSPIDTSGSAGATAGRSSGPLAVLEQNDASPAAESLQLAHLIAQQPALLTRNPGFIMPVVSGSGGAGKSTIAVLSAFCASALGYRTLLLDYDLQFGDVAVMTGVERPLTIDEAIAYPDKIDQMAVNEGRPALIAAPGRLELAEGVARAVPALLDRVAPMFDVVIANTGAAWAEQHAALLERSTVTLFLVDQRSSSVRACRHALSLCARCGIATGQFKFALNRCAKSTPLSTMDVSCALQGAPVAELREGGRDVEDYLAAGAVDELIKSGNELCASVARLLADVLPDAGASADGASSRGRAFALGKRRGRHVSKRKGWSK